MEAEVILTLVEQEMLIFERMNSIAVLHFTLYWCFAWELKDNNFKCFALVLPTGMHHII